ncbi:hypothetical protein OUZ56_005619 [Daphnia magna]|uniref:MULE transposase domain-containing protein n=1 Tax=Daphnia magna TaxID=35525 RepID=A0ABQ9YTA0_9CRUS|nr:hypothetical protein OUZ56_005619 [Daphnia magna]
MISDYEEAILVSMQHAFPTGRSRGCWFHYSQAIYRRACQEGLSAAYLAGGVVRRIIKMLIALALLPQERIFEGFQCIRNTTADDLERETQEVRGAIAQLFTYYGGYWIASQGSERISVCDDDD